MDSIMNSSNQQLLDLAQATGQIIGLVLAIAATIGLLYFITKLLKYVDDEKDGYDPKTTYGKIRNRIDDFNDQRSNNQWRKTFNVTKPKKWRGPKRAGAFYANKKGYASSDQLRTIKYGGMSGKNRWK